VLENVKGFYRSHDLEEQLSVALALASSSAILLMAAIIGIWYQYTISAFAISLILLCFLLIFVMAFCLLKVLKLSVRLSATKKALIVAAAVTCIAIICVMST
jgi:hypothetical protein